MRSPLRKPAVLSWAGVVLAFFFATATPAAAASTDPSPVSSGDLIEHPKQYNGRHITFQGEVIGEVQVRGDFAWLAVNDDAYQDRSVEEGRNLAGYNSGQAVWVPAAQVQSISAYGMYFEGGDIVKVSGVFNRACPIHGGDMDIHASSLQVVKAGHPIPHPFQTGKASIAVILAAIALTTGLFVRQVRQHPPTDYSPSAQPPVT